MDVPLSNYYEILVMIYNKFTGVDIPDDGPFPNLMINILNLDLRDFCTWYREQFKVLGNIN